MWKKFFCFKEPKIFSFRKSPWSSRWSITIELAPPSRSGASCSAAIRWALKCGTGRTCWPTLGVRSHSGTLWAIWARKVKASAKKRRRGTRTHLKKDKLCARHKRQLPKPSSSFPFPRISISSSLSCLWIFPFRLLVVWKSHLEFLSIYDFRHQGLSRFHPLFRTLFFLPERWEARFQSFGELLFEILPCYSSTHA